MKVCDIEYEPVNELQGVGMCDTTASFTVAEGDDHVKCPSAAKAESSDNLNEQSCMMSHKDWESLKGDFLSIRECLKLLQLDNTLKVHDEVPCGPKSNVFFLVNNEHNIMRRDNNLPSRFWDDCGVWDTHEGRGINTYYQLPQLTERRLNKEGLYSLRKRVGGKIVSVPMEVQPAPQDIVVVSR
jgi:hypothetical protein